MTMAFNQRGGYRVTGKQGGGAWKEVLGGRKGYAVSRTAITKLPGAGKKWRHALEGRVQAFGKQPSQRNYYRSYFKPPAKSRVWPLTCGLFLPPTLPPPPPQPCLIDQVGPRPHALVGRRRRRPLLLQAARAAAALPFPCLPIVVFHCRPSPLLFVAPAPAAGPAGVVALF